MIGMTNLRFMTETRQFGFLDLDEKAVILDSLDDSIDLLTDLKITDT